MKVLLKKHVDNLGDVGDIVDVKNGYGRNYLIPQGKARMATEGVLHAHREEMRQAMRKRLEKKEEAEAAAEELESLDIEIPAKVGEGDRIFGTVTTQQIAVELSKRGFDIDRRNIELDEDIRTTGVFTASVQLHSDVTGAVNVQVVPMADI